LSSARQKAIELLKAHGLRCGRSRIEILRTMIEAHRPVSASDILERVADENVNPVTVYRTLSRLIESGIAARVSSEGRERLYEVHAGARCRASHVHFVCRGCGDIRCLEWIPAREQDIRLGSGYRIEAQSLFLYGRCPRCPTMASR